MRASKSVLSPIAVCCSLCAWVPARTLNSFMVLLKVSTAPEDSATTMLVRFFLVATVGRRTLQQTHSTFNGEWWKFTVEIQ